MDKGVVLILAIGLLAIFGIMGAGYIMGVYTPRTGAAAIPVKQAAAANAVQDVYVKTTATGYDTPVIYVKANEPVRFHFSSPPTMGCGMSLLIPAFGVQLLSRGEDEVAEFTPPAGQYAFNCPMRMWRGTLIAS